MLRQQCILTALAIRLITLSGTNIYIPSSVTYFLASFKLIDIRRVQVNIASCWIYYSCMRKLPQSMPCKEEEERGFTFPTNAKHLTAL